MAIRSDYGYFQVTNVTITPEIAAIGESAAITISIKNTSGAKITSAWIAIRPVYINMQGYGIDIRPTDLLGANKVKGSISWANNETKTFIATMTLEPYPLEEQHSEWPITTIEPCIGRLIQGEVWQGEQGTGVMSALGMSFVWMRSSSEYMDFIEDISGGSYTYDDETMEGTGYYDGILKLLRNRWAPAAMLSVKRCFLDGTESDEGQYLLVTARIGKSQYADVSQMTCRLYYEENGPVSASSNYIDLASSIQTLLDGVTDDRAIAPQMFTNGSDWSFMLWFGDTYESAIAAATISRAFANLHLAGASTGGVAFGKFSASTLNNPLFECEYPALFNGGIAGVTNYASGEAATGGTWIDGKPIHRFVTVFTTTSTSTSTLYFDANALPSDWETIVNLYGSVKNPNGNAFSLNYSAYSGANVVVYVIAPDNASHPNAIAVRFNASAPTGTKTFAVVVEYTKAD